MKHPAEPSASRLLPELLDETFKWLHAMHLNSIREHHVLFELRPRAETTIPLVTRIAVSQVCRQWREVAVDCAPFWSIIPLHNIAWADISLRRSKSASVLVDLHVQRRIDSYALSLCLESLSRFYILRMGLRSALSADALKVSDASQLEELCLTGGLISDDIFRGSVPPRLNSVTLTNCTFTTSLPILSANLTNLHLSLTQSPWRTAAALLDSLRRAPLLENLAVEKATIPQTPNDTIKNVPAVKFPHLRGLSLHGALPVITPFFQHIVAPALKKVIFLTTLVTEGLPETQDSIRTLIGKLFRGASNDRAYRKVQFTDLDDGLEALLAFALTASYYDSNPLYPVRKETPSSGETFSFEFGIMAFCTTSRGQGMEYIASMLTEIFKNMPAARADDVQLLDLPSIPDFRNTLVAHAGPRIERLYFRSQPTTMMMLQQQRQSSLATGDLEAIIESARNQDVSSLPGLPRLRAVEIEDVAFMDNQNNALPVFELLLLACYHAHEGRRAFSLTLTKCRLSQAMEDQLYDALGRDLVFFQDCYRALDNSRITHLIRALESALANQQHDDEGPAAPATLPPALTQAENAPAPAGPASAHTEPVPVHAEPTPAHVESVPAHTEPAALAPSEPTPAESTPPANAVTEMSSIGPTAQVPTTGTQAARRGRTRRVMTRVAAVVSFLRPRRPQA